jgi:hypothetical protein
VLSELFGVVGELRYPQRPVVFPAVTASEDIPGWGFSPEEAQIWRAFLRPRFFFVIIPFPARRKWGQDSLAASIGSDHRSLLLATLSANRL